MSDHTQESHLEEPGAHPAPVAITNHQESTLGLQMDTNPVINAQYALSEGTSEPHIASPTSTEPDTKSASGNLRPGFFAAGGSM